jgi:endoglucanase
VSWSSPGATAIVNAWGMDCTLSGSTITCTGVGWAASLAPGQTVRVGLQVAASRVPSAPAVTTTSS